MAESPQAPRIAVEQLQKLREGLILAPFRGPVPAQDRIGEIGGGLLVEPAKFQDICAECIFAKPRLMPARAEQRERAPAFQSGEQALQFRLLGLGQRVLDRKRRARDRFQIVEDEKVALGFEGLRQIGLLQLLGQRQERAVKAAGIVELFGNRVKDLLASPGLLVIAEIENLLDEARLLPPAAEMMQKRALARAAHAVHEQDVAGR